MRLSLLCLTILLVLSAVALLIPMPQAGPAGHALADLAHAPCFAFLAWLVYSILVARGEYHRTQLAIVVWCALVVFGASTEIAQTWFGRRASYHDFFANVAGITAGLLIASAQEKSQRRARWLAASLLIGLAIFQPALTLVDAAIAWRQFPQVASFEQPLELRRWVPQHSTLARVQGHATDGDWAMQMDLSPAPYPGAYIVVTQRDWSAYDTLALDIYRPSHSIFSTANRLPFTIIVKVEDVAHDGESHDRFHRTVNLKLGANAIRIPLSDIAAAPRDRDMDMTRINIVQIFTIDLKQERTLYIDNIRLEREVEPAAR